MMIMRKQRMDHKLHKVHHFGLLSNVFTCSWGITWWHAKYTSTTSKCVLRSIDFNPRVISCQHAGARDGPCKDDGDETGLAN